MTYLHWLTSIREPILEVVNEMCCSPMTISSSCKFKSFLQSIQYLLVYSTHFFTKICVKNWSMKSFVSWGILFFTRLLPHFFLLLWCLRRGLIFLLSIIFLSDRIKDAHHGIMKINQQLSLANKICLQCRLWCFKSVF